MITFGLINIILMKKIIFLLLIVPMASQAQFKDLIKKAGEKVEEAAPPATAAAATPRRGGRRRSAAASPAEELRGRSKVCQECGKDQPLTEYHVDRNARDGLKGKCKDCKRRMTQGLQKQIMQEGRARRSLREASKLERWNPDIKGEEEPLRPHWQEARKRADNDALLGQLASLRSAAAAAEEEQRGAAEVGTQNDDDDLEDDVLMRHAHIE